MDNELAEYIGELETIIADLVAALEAVQRDFGRRELTAETVTQVHAAIEAAEQS